MRHHWSIVVLTLGLALSKPAFACEKFVDKDHLLAFGTLELGDNRSQLPNSVKKLDGCLEQPSNNYYDCAYRDDDGVTYWVYGDTIVRKDIEVMADYRGHLLAEIKPGDSIGEVLRKFRSLPEGFPHWTALASKDEDSMEALLTTGECLLTSDGSLYVMYLVFDKDDKLVGLTAQFILL